VSGIYDEPWAYELACSFRDVPGEVGVLLGWYARHTDQERPASVLELAAGPAEHAREFLRRGIAATALDLNPAMCAYAAAKAPDLDVVQADMTAFDLGREFDLVVTALDSTAHLMTLDAFVAHLDRAARIWRRGGLYILEQSHPADRLLDVKRSSSSWSFEGRLGGVGRAGRRHGPDHSDRRGPRDDHDHPRRRDPGGQRRGPVPLLDRHRGARRRPPVRSPGDRRSVRRLRRHIDHRPGGLADDHGGSGPPERLRPSRASVVGHVGPATSAAILASAVSSSAAPMVLRVSSIQAAICGMSFSVRPRVVIAAVPRRRPDGSKACAGRTGRCCSQLRSRPCRGLGGRLAGNALAGQVDEDQVVVGAAGDQVEAALQQGLGERLWRWPRSAVRRCGRKAARPRRARTAMAAVVWLCGPPCRPGKTLVDGRGACSAVVMSIAPRGPRSVLWVVVEITST